MFKNELTKETIYTQALVTCGRPFEELTAKERYKVVSKTVMGAIAEKWQHTDDKFKENKKAYYLSAEFLMGRALSNNLINIGAQKEVKDILEQMGEDYGRIEEAEADAGLGNGGLGRLAACYLDSAATLDYPLMGYGIRYEYGLFRQKIINGMQVEEADDWGALTDPWAIRKDEEKLLVTFAKEKVYAIPYDTPIIGYGGNTINTLRLFTSEPVIPFDFEKFNKGNYEDSVRQRVEASNISRVLYPNDESIEGKILRLKQQYFFVSAALQDMIRKYQAEEGIMDDFHKYHAVQLNDTHPVVAVPELIRLLMTGCGMEFEKAFEITYHTLAYTNHTILQEALEKWDVELFKTLLPEVYEIVEKIQEKLVAEMELKGLSEEEIEDISIIRDEKINMAYLAIYSTHSTNGVAQLHTDILKEKELNNWFKIYPERFNNKTNGITQRRWLLNSNPELSAFITELLGTDEWITDLPKLKGLMKFKDDENVLKRFMDIKLEKKRQLAEYIRFNDATELDLDSVFDIQIKRLHEYKRQLMNAFHILDLYYRIKDGEEMSCKRSFIFGAKAAPGYYRAKGVIKFINEIKNLIDADEEVSKYLSVVFVENYSVSYGEKLFPAADISEQISTTGKEASGTGNMKFMLNGAATIGTLDGANVEIVEEAGEENNFIFGLKLDEIQKMQENYDPKEYYKKVKGLKRVIDTLIDGSISDDGTGAFEDIYESLLEGHDWERADTYFILADFDSYREAHERICLEYTDKIAFAQKCFINMASAGKFSSDRSVDEYAKDIWNVDQVK